MLEFLLSIFEAAFPVYLLVVGVVMTLGGLAMVRRRLVTLLFGVRVRGQIIRWERQRDSDNPQTFFYFPHIGYRDLDGVAHEMRIDAGSSREKYPIGHPYDVRYNRTNPARAYAANPFTMLLGPVLVFAMGLFCFWIVLFEMR